MNFLQGLLWVFMNRVPLTGMLSRSFPPFNNA